MILILNYLILNTEINQRKTVDHNHINAGASECSSWRKGELAPAAAAVILIFNRSYSMAANSWILCRISSGRMKLCCCSWRTHDWTLDGDLKRMY